MKEKKQKKQNELIQVRSAIDDLSSDSKFTYPFDCAPLDIILGGGVKSGKIYEFFGKESNGKSTLALEASKAFTNYWDNKGDNNYKVLWIESESAFDKARAKWMGCDISKYDIAEVDTVEDGFSLMYRMLEEYKEKNIKSLIIWDTIAAVATDAEKEKEDMYAGGMSEKARLIKAGFRKLTFQLSDCDSSLILVNQVYSKIGTYIPEIESPGGSGIKFHSAVRARLTQKGQPISVTLPNGEERNIGITTEIYTIKNKLTLPNQKCMIYLMGETGLDQIETTLNFLKSQEIIKVGGAGWCTIDNVPKSVGEMEGQQLKFQNSAKFKTGTMIEFPKIKKYLDYLIYKFFTDVSPLLKVRLIDKIWNYEKEFYNEKKTEISVKEFEIALLIHKDLIKEIDK